MSRRRLNAKYRRQIFFLRRLLSLSHGSLLSLCWAVLGDVLWPSWILLSFLEWNSTDKNQWNGVFPLLKLADFLHQHQQETNLPSRKRVPYLLYRLAS